MSHGVQSDVRLDARGRAVVLFVLLALASAAALVGGPARADTAPGAGVPATVSADALPTWQVNGVVWSEVVVGTTVYATGSFTAARPPGVAVGGAGSVAAANLFAFDVRIWSRGLPYSATLLTKRGPTYPIILR